MKRDDFTAGELKAMADFRYSTEFSDSELDALLQLSDNREEFDAIKAQMSSHLDECVSQRIQDILAEFC
jgi:hypothetical protein